jgi:hypothetical protein
MDPAQNQTSPVTGMEYLNQISTKPPSKFSFINRKILIGAIAFVVLLVGLIIATAVLNNRDTSSSELLSAQLTSFNTLVNYNSNNEINNAAVKKVTAEASLITASAKTRLATVTTLPSPSKEVTAGEAVNSTIEMLNLAKSTGNLSQKYIAALQSKLQEILASLDQLYQQASSASRRQVIEEVKSDFIEINNRLDNI